MNTLPYLYFNFIKYKTLITLINNLLSNIFFYKMLHGKSINYIKKITIVKKQNYLIISAYADDIEEFAESVQSMIVEGWQLNGGISSSTSMLYQSLRKI